MNILPLVGARLVIKEQAGVNPTSDYYHDQNSEHPCHKSAYSNIFKVFSENFHSDVYKTFVIPSNMQTKDVKLKPTNEQ